MQQMKIFKGVESELADLEQRINQFLKESNARVVHMTGNIAPQSVTAQQDNLGKSYTPSDILIAVVYETA